jgi:pimeloyl-ACP methyl ester carboxylesterase
VAWFPPKPTCAAAVAVAITVLASCSSPASTGTTTARHAAVVTSLDVINAPVKVADTAAGPVGYREVGAGSPLLLITGLGGSIDSWPPSFVATLAADHQVVVPDNPGVGLTVPLNPPTSITVLADQTSALISTLRLGRVAVLGWSMGGMIAQALAVLHPAQVSRLVLAATQPGTGHAAAARAYAASILRYPDYYQAPRNAVASQSLAVQQWLVGDDDAGPHFGQVRLPVLVADGTLDQLDPSANDRALAGLVPGAKLLLYPGAGHAFLFQDAASFLPAVERFLR